MTPTATTKLAVTISIAVTLGLPAGGGAQDAAIVLGSGVQFPDGSVQGTAAVGVAPVADSGQRECFDTAGAARDCLGTGEDGELQAGSPGPNPRFTDNQDGTITDNRSGLMWLQDAGCLIAPRTWQTDLDHVGSFNSENVCDGYYPNTGYFDWRMPNVNELLTLVDYGQKAPALPSGHPFLNVSSSTYWTSTTVAGITNAAWTVDLAFGMRVAANKATVQPVWLVRGGP